MDNALAQNNFPLGKWILQRFNPLDFTIVAALCMAAVFNLHPLVLGQDNFIKYFVSLFLMAMQFRLLEDLFDFDINQERFPDRVMSQLSDTKSFWVFYYVLFLFNIMIVYMVKPGDNAYLLFAVFCVLAKSWRKIVRPIVRSDALVSFVKMLKYPVFVLILMPSYMRDFTSVKLWVLVLLVYFAFLIYDFTSTEYVKNKLIANGLHVLFGGILIWSLFFQQVYNKTEIMVFAIIMSLVYLAYFIDFNRKGVFPRGFCVFYSMMILVFMELNQINPTFN